MTSLKSRFMRLAWMVICLCGVVFCSSVVAHGAEPVASGVICEGGCNLRASYSTSSDIVTVLSESAVVTITKEKHTSSSSTAATTRWFYIKKGSTTGWVRADCLDITYSPVTGTATGVANVRKGPGTGYDSVGQTAKGDEITIRLKTENASGKEWYKVLYGGSVRYIYGSYVSLPEIENTVNTDFESELAAFPSTYHDSLRALHEKYPSWHFKANVMSYTWSAGLAEQMSNYAANTIPISKPDGYKRVCSGTYDFDNHYYYGLDGDSWVGASKKAVAYYMDPRNWLDEINIFMFESLLYNPATQSEAMVKQLLSATAINPKFSSSYMQAGEDYNISPVYLAAKSRLELGSSDYMVSGTKFTYEGKTYQGYYNAYNIGASDSASGDAAKKGLVFAASGTSYLRPWKTLDLAIRGGAKFIAEDFIGNQQHTLYYERFNVANGLSNIGTHQYMTNTMAAATQANITYWEYEDNNLLDTPFTFEIPVYQDMPSANAEMPGKGNNNCYLDSLKVYEGSTRKYFTSSFNRFTSTYTLKTTVSASKLTIKTETNASDATVTVTGNTNLKNGDNKIRVKVVAASGVVKNYYINVTKIASVEAAEVTGSVDTNGKPTLTWNSAANADKYAVYVAEKKSGTYTLLNETTSRTYTHSKAEIGKTYYYKVKSIGEDGVVGEATSDIVSVTCTLPAPVVKIGNKASTGKPQLTWDAIDGAKSYEVYRSEAKDGEYTKMWTLTGTSYTNTKAEAGVKYYYKVKAISDTSTSLNSPYSNVKSRICDLPQPVVSIGNHPSNGKPQLTWEAIEGAAKYEVYRSEAEDGEYTKMWTLTGTTYTNTKAEAGVKYYYKVKAISEVQSGADSAYSEVKARICDLPQPVVSIGNRPSNGKPQLTWEAIEGAAEYEVYRSEAADGEYTKMWTLTGTTYTNTKAKAGVKYYYKVKAISEVRSGANSAYSDVKSRICDLPRPVVSIELREKDGKPQLTWDAIDGAAEYEIYRSKTEDGTFSLLYTTQNCKFTNTGAKSGVTYYYTVKAISEVRSGANSAQSETVTVTSK